MNGLDIALAVLLFFFFLRGIFRGFVKEVVGIFGLIGGFYLASKYYPAMADTIKPFIQNTAYRNAIGFEIIFLAAFFLIGLFGLLIDKLIKLTISNVANGLLGAVIGVAKGVALACVVLMAATVFIRQDTSFFKDSVSWPYLETFTENLKTLIPEDLKASFEEKAILLPETIKQDIPDISDAYSDQPAPWKPIQPELDAADDPAPPAWPGSNDSNN